jgi:hypothetical protein
LEEINLAFGEEVAVRLDEITDQDVAVQIENSKKMFDSHLEVEQVSRL